MGTSKNSLTRWIGGLLNRFFNRKKLTDNSKSHFQGTFDSLKKNVGNQPHSSFHGDEESFWFI